MYAQLPFLLIRLYWFNPTKLPYPSQFTFFSDSFQNASKPCCTTDPDGKLVHSARWLHIEFLYANANSGFLFLQLVVKHYLILNSVLIMRADSHYSEKETGVKF